jgi:hypothetical protein
MLLERSVIILAKSEVVGSAMGDDEEAVEWVDEEAAKEWVEESGEAERWPEDRRNPDTKLSRASGPLDVGP